jgi:hypothetical protein
MRNRVWGSLEWLGMVVVLLLAAECTIDAGEKTAAELFSPTTVGYLEVPQASRLAEVVLNHPLAKEIANQPGYQKALQGREYQQVQAVLKMAEEKLGMNWRRAVASLTDGGLSVGFDLPTQGIAALAQATDESLALKARDAVLELARADAAAKNKPNPVQEDNHRGITIYQLGDVHFAVLGKRLLAANKRLLFFMMLENYLGNGTSLASNEQFQAVRKDRSGQPAAWLYVDLRLIRITGMLKALNKKSNNPPAELLAGGILGALPDAPYVTASLELDASHLKLTTTLPADPRAIAKSREFYFGAEGNGAAPPLLRPQGSLLTLSTYRDLASLWRHAPDLFDERVNAKMAEAESGLATFFGGRNFRDEILGNLQPGLQLVVARQQFPQAGVTPAIKLPAAAVVLRMKRPAETTRVFKITFQSLIGFLNIVGGMKGLPPLDLNSEKSGSALVIGTEYLPPDKIETRDEAAIHFNASPTAVFIGDRFILSSARSLAMDLAEQVQHELPAAADINTSLLVDANVTRAVLTDNRGPLIARNMLDRGHDRVAAEHEIDGLLRALAGVEQSSIQLTADGQRLQLSVAIALAPAQ